MVEVIPAQRDHDVALRTLDAPFTKSLECEHRYPERLVADEPAQSRHRENPPRPEVIEVLIESLDGVEVVLAEGEGLGGPCREGVGEPDVDHPVLRVGAGQSGASVADCRAHARKAVRCAGELPQGTVDRVADRPVQLDHLDPVHAGAEGIEDVPAAAPTDDQRSVSVAHRIAQGADSEAQVAPVGDRAAPAIACDRRRHAVVVQRRETSLRRRAVPEDPAQGCPAIGDRLHVGRDVDGLRLVKLGLRCDGNRHDSHRQEDDGCADSRRRRLARKQDRCEGGDGRQSDYQRRHVDDPHQRHDGKRTQRRAGKVERVQTRDGVRVAANRERDNRSRYAEKHGRERARDRQEQGECGRDLAAGAVADPHEDQGDEQQQARQESRQARQFLLQRPLLEPLWPYVYGDRAGPRSE